jgi:hypothetical protein
MDDCEAAEFGCDHDEVTLSAADVGALAREVTRTGR